MNDAPVSDLLGRASIKTEIHLMAFSDSSWQYCPDTVISTEKFIIFYQGGPIDYGTHVPGPSDQASAESEYNVACTEGIVLSHFRMLIHELLIKDPDIVPEESPFIVLNSKSAMCMANNGKDTKHTRHIARIIHFVRWEKSVRCTRLICVREVCNWQTLLPIMLLRLTKHQERNILWLDLTTETEHLYKRGDRIQNSLLNKSYI